MFLSLSQMSFFRLISSPSSCTVHPCSIEILLNVFFAISNELAVIAYSIVVTLYLLFMPLLIRTGLAILMIDPLPRFMLSSLGAIVSVTVQIKQSTVARSSIEVEYHAIASTTTKLNSVSHLLSKLGITLVSNPTIYYDKVNATYLCANPVFHLRVKHIAIDFHFGHDQVTKHLLHVSYVHTIDQLANSLTKPLSQKSFFFTNPSLASFWDACACRGMIANLSSPYLVLY